MALKTSAGSGLWSDPSTWDTGVPVDNDSVVIAAGHVVEFDVDQSGFANGIDTLTITGTLSLTRITGTYYLKIKAAKTINGAGTFDCGTALSPIPFAAKHTITGGAGWYIKGNDGAGMTMTVYAAEPAVKTVLLTGAESAGATVLEVDTDVTGDIWADGDAISICNINRDKNAEARVIAAGGIAAGAITITAGLTGAKIAGTVVHLTNRNVRFVGVTARILQNFTTGKLTIAGGEFTGGAHIFSGSAADISGGVFHGVNPFYLGSAVISGGVFTNFNDMTNTTNMTISGGEFSGFIGFGANSNGAYISGGTWRGNTYCINGVGATITGGTFSGCNYPVHGAIGIAIIGGTFSGNNYGLRNSSAVIQNAILSNTIDVKSSIFTAFNCSFNGIENSNYTHLSKLTYSESYDHDQVAGAYKAWTKGGVTTLQAVTKPTGHASAMQSVLENASVEGYWQREITVGAGASVNLEMWLRKDSAMTYLPRCIVFNKASADPCAGGAGLHTFTMTGSIDTWEDDLYTYTNTGTEDVTLVIRCQGMNATGNMYSALDIEQINVDLTNAIALLTEVKAKTDNLPASPAQAGEYTSALSAIQADLDNADQYKADVSNLALEATLTAMKGAGWTAETLKAIKDAIAALPAGISTADIMNTVVEGTFTLQDVLRIMASAQAGKLDGGGTGTLTFRDLSDTLDRIIATVDLATGDRDTITLDLT